MLTFEQKIAIADSFAELQRKDVSMGRVNYQYDDSKYDKKTIVYHLHPNGNGFVFAGLLEDVAADDKGNVNIRDFSEAEMRDLIRRSIDSLMPEKPAKDGHEELWTDSDGQKLKVKFEDDMWYIFAGMNLEAAYETYEEAKAYLREEGFART